MKRILLRSPNWIGDQVLAYPFYRRLREVYPQAWIAVACTEWVKDIQYQGLVDEVFVIPKKKGANAWTSLLTLGKFSKKIKAQGPWNLGISLPNSFSAALLLYLAGAQERRGYDTDVRGFLLTQKLTWNPSPEIHRAQAYLNLMQPDGLPPFAAREYWTESGEPSFDPIRYWPDVTPIEPPRDPYFIIAPGATADSRRWSIEQFSELIRQIHEKHALRAVIVGGNAEREIAVDFLKGGLPVDDFTGKGWVAAHWKLFKQSQFTICNESGLAHVAALCGSKVHIVCGAGRS